MSEPSDECTHEYRLAERYESERTSNTYYVFYCIHCLEFVVKVR